MKIAFMQQKRHDLVQKSTYDESDYESKCNERLSKKLSICRWTRADESRSVTGTSSVTGNEKAPINGAFSV